MKRIAFVAFVELAALASAFKTFAPVAKRDGVDDHPWLPVPPGGVRAPCPGTNTLANHGYINRDGRKITAEAYRQGFHDAFGFGMETLIQGTNNAVNLCSSITNSTCTAFDLDMLATPHRIEHDGSMTRCDVEMKTDPHADNNAFNQTIWDLSKAIYADASRGSTHVGKRISNTVRLRRFEQARDADVPGWFIQNNGGSGAEHAFILSTMNDPALGRNLSHPQARFDWIDYWFTHERLPTDLGWVKPTSTIPPLGSLNMAIRAQRTIPPRSSTSLSSSSTSSSMTTSEPPSSTTTSETTSEPNTSTVPTTSTYSSFPPRRPNPTSTKRHRERRDQERIPLSALPQLVQNPRGKAAVNRAAAIALNQAPPPPTVADAYDYFVSVQRFREVGEAAKEYVSEVQGVFQKVLANILD